MSPCFSLLYVAEGGSKLEEKCMILKIFFDGKPPVWLQIKGRGVYWTYQMVRLSVISTTSMKGNNFNDFLWFVLFSVTKQSLEVFFTLSDSSA